MVFFVWQQRPQCITEEDLPHPLLPLLPQLPHPHPREELLTSSKVPRWSPKTSKASKLSAGSEFCPRTISRRYSSIKRGKSIFGQYYLKTRDSSSNSFFSFQIIERLRQCHLHASAQPPSLQWWEAAVLCRLHLRHHGPVGSLRGRQPQAASSPEPGSCGCCRRPQEPALLTSCHPEQERQAEQQLRGGCLGPRCPLERREPGRRIEEE